MTYTVADTPEGQRICKVEEELEDMFNDPNLTPELREKLELLSIRLDLATDHLLECHKESLTLSQN